MSLKSCRPMVVQTSWQCTSCLLRRAISTSTTNPNVGPESPRYIEVPESRQATKPERTRLKGILPVPRRIFGHGEAKARNLSKADEAALRQKTKLPQRPRVHLGPHAELQAYKSRMADMRRQSLREGLEAMRDRQLAIDQRTRSRVSRRHAQRQERIDRPEREDERLTSPSVDPAVKAYLTSKTLPDPDRAERIEAMRRRTEEVAATREEARMMAMQTLYMNARDFIVDEKQLDAAVDRAFGTEEYPVGFGMFSREESVWTYGAQINAFGMLKRSQPSELTGMLSEVMNAELTKKRLQTMAEELTGGKMDSP